MSSPILLAYDFDGAGGGKSVSDKVIARELKNDNLAWVHLDGNHPDTKPWLDKEISYLDPFVVDALIAEETRPRVAEIGDGALLILRGVNLNEDADPEDMVSIRLWIDKARIISVQRRNLKAVYDVEDRIRMNKGPRDAGEFINMLLARLSDRMALVLTELDEETDDVEERILEDPDTSLRERIIGIRKEAIMLRRYMAPQKDAIGQLRLAEFSWLEGPHRRHLQENYDHLMRYVEDLDAIRERAQIIKDELANIIADKLNRNLYILSVIAAIFLPLGFLTGLLGINVGGIPGDQYPYAFAIFCGILTVLVILQILIFRKLKWF
ncbi:MAG: zinc transporter ZntB [Sneathiella sp.]|jgi:zinc transporter|uniref:zinc transporter ZntB n=1 Tax=Sneathiella sp. TaxID=1964365 RepID=UPI000C68DD2A|nr:zinc transporter ZntB [Sneathiella sp.]MAL79001.1 zinc transporter ZntB [Sneathiella sp.]|tara:strand:+ start:1545 stop:2516 length:972 start_codon:yes stop_codon:yes gene_type:complete